MIIRTSKHNIHNITNKNKLNSIDKLFIDYKICLEYYIDLILTNKLPLKTNLSSKLLPAYNIKHSRYKQLIYKHASEIIRSQTKKCINKRYKKYKYVYTYFKKNNRQQNFINKRFKELNLKDIYLSKYFTKPNLKSISINLDERFFDIKYGSSFDNFVKIILPYFNEKGTQGLKVKVPLKQHKHSNKLKDNDFKLRKNIQLQKISGKYFINLVWEKENKVKTAGKTLGLDLGYKKLIVSSNSEFIGSEMIDIYEKICRKQQGSINFKQTLIERDNLINYYVNQLKLDDINILYIEDLLNVKHKSKGKINKIFNNKLQRWSYVKTIDKITRICEEKGILLVKVSPMYTSQTCSNCGHIDKKSRNGENYQCVSCSYKIDADLNAAININNRGIYSSSNNTKQIHYSKNNLQL